MSVRKDAARALRALARKLDPPPHDFDDYDEEYDYLGEVGPPSPPHVCNEECPVTCRMVSSALKEFRDHLDREMGRTDLAGGLFSTTPYEVKRYDLRVPGALKEKP